MGTYPVPYRPIPHCVLPSGCLDGFFDALSRHHSSPVSVMAYGDSLTQGQASDKYSLGEFDWRLGSWLYQAMAALQSQVSGLEHTAEFFSMGETSDWTTYRSPGYGSVTPWDHIDTATYDTHGWYFTPTFPTVNTWASAADALTKFTSPPNSIALDLFDAAPFITTPPFTYKYNIDGTPGDANDVTVTWDATSANPRKTRIVSGKAKQRTIHFGNQSEAQRMRLLGMTSYSKEGSGLQFGRIAYSGKTMGQFALHSAFPDRFASLFQDDQSFGFPCAPDLAIVSLGVNDNNDTFGDFCLRPEGFESALNSIVDAHRRGKPNGSIMFIGNLYPLPQYGDMSGWANPESWIYFLEAMEKVARRRTCAFVNFHASVGALALTKGYVTSTDPHLTREGHAALGSLIADVLAG